MKKPPFDDSWPSELVDLLTLRREAAFLYDAVKLYAKSLKKSLEQKLDVRNGIEIINRLKSKPYTR